MERSYAEDLGAPDSWEAEDLDERLSKLLVSPTEKKKTPASIWAPSDLSDDPTPDSDYYYSSPAPVAVSKAIPDDVLNQVDEFLREALEKPRERLSILRMEQDVEKFIRDPAQQQLEFQSLPTSYLRLAAHRVAQHYYLQSMVVPDDASLDGSGSRIVLYKTSAVCQFPRVRLADIPVNLVQESDNLVAKVAIKQRADKRSQTMSNFSGHSSKTNHRKSVEERKEEYNRARARIFSSNPTSGSISKSERERTLPYNFQHCSLASTRQDENNIGQGSELIVGRCYADSSSSRNGSNRNRTEKDPVVSRYNVNNKVAIFRDREVDRKDPDYDRNYERYMQRFDPGFGFNGGGPYAIQPMCVPAVNYNTEFPQLGLSHQPQISMDRLPRPIPQNLRGNFLATSAPNEIGYGPQEAMIPPFDPSHVGLRAASSHYMHTSQYPAHPRPGMMYGPPHEHVQPFAQTHQQQRDSSFGVARPR